MSSLMTTAAAREVLEDEDLLGEILAHLTPAHLAAKARVCSAWRHSVLKIEDARVAAHSVAGLGCKLLIPAGARVRVLHEGGQRPGVIPTPWSDKRGPDGMRLPSAAFELLACDPKDEPKERLAMLKAGRMVVALDSLEGHVAEPILASVADVEILDHNLYRYLLRAQGGDPFAAIALGHCLTTGQGGLPLADPGDGAFYYGLAEGLEVPYAIAYANYSSGWWERHVVRPPRFQTLKEAEDWSGWWYEQDDYGSDSDAYRYDSEPEEYDYHGALYEGGCPDCGNPNCPGAW